MLKKKKKKKKVTDRDSDCDKKGIASGEMVGIDRLEAAATMNVARLRKLRLLKRRGFSMFRV
ncbi:hypothetical protein IMY05_014G0058400 [Salix suchowensis]|nr:hypothetical protein IMY05_014G0058400 [Salix suchowensis]